MHVQALALGLIGSLYKIIFPAQRTEAVYSAKIICNF